MASADMSAIKRFIFWDYARASWQYDVMVVLILAFVFLTPRELFRDQPKPTHIVRLPSEQGSAIFWVEPQLLEAVPKADRSPKVEHELRSRFGQRETVTHVEPILGSEQEVLGYMAYTTGK
ncbi:MAG: hypothetical protein H7039_06875 [Bryobacteraceae bacterium]|nr:hypothetical protein [Bryobacteraceae bacterium]